MTDEEKELQKYAEMAAWDRFKQEVQILKGYQFKEEQLHNHISIMFNANKKMGNDYVIKGSGGMGILEGYGECDKKE